MVERNFRKFWDEVSDEVLQKWIDWCIEHKTSKIDMMVSIIQFSELLDEKLRRNEIY